ncbi:MAG: efflux RND transporter periplasmic adaptor subunit [Planctomycetes bacterium]|nr:efflux RND transporter periplasmic adaptor subunit [Planctomycetota bacterium]
MNAGVPMQTPTRSGSHEPSGAQTARLKFSRIRLLSLLVSLTLFIGCNKSAKPDVSKKEPAHVDHHVDEQDLNKITLTEQAEKRLGIQLVETALTEIQRRRTVGGEVLLPPGKTITISAPIAGTLSHPPGTTAPVPGNRLEAGSTVFAFAPLLTPERDVLTPSERVRVAQTKADIATAQIDAERQIESAKISVQAAKIAYDRAAQLLNNKAGSQRNVDEASANLELAREALITAETRHKFLSAIRLDEQAGELASREIESPVAGVLQTLDAAVGETVVGGEPLFSVITTSRVWIRVPIYAGQWREIDTTQPATIAEFGQASIAKLRQANYVLAPPSANPTAATIDVYYEVENEDELLHPGQRLAVTVPLHIRAESLVVPFKSILYDIHGNTWVYEETDAHVYARQRVSVDYVDGDSAVLASGPEPGSKIVTDGAVELFGTEFGVGH